MKSRVLIIAMLITLFLCGCDQESVSGNSPKTINSSVTSSTDDDTGNSSTPTATDPVTSQPDSNNNNSLITEDDFNIPYDGIIINDSVSFEEIAKDLGINLGEEIANSEYKAATQYGYWYVVHYPSTNYEDLRIEYVQSKVFGTYIVRCDLYNVKTSRNIGVGDSEESLLAAYGDTVVPIENGDDLVYYKYPLSNDQSKVYSEDKVITFIVDKTTKLITEVYTNYNNNRAMSDLDIVAFD